MMCPALHQLQDLLAGERVSHLHLAGHEVQELREVDGAVAISINLVDHVLQLCLCWVLAQAAHDCAQLLGGDGACSSERLIM